MCDKIPYRSEVEHDAITGFAAFTRSHVSGKYFDFHRERTVHAAGHCNRVTV
jgi:hypothetical protein